MRFAALVIVGDGNGKIGVATGKAKEVPEAIEKAKADGSLDEEVLREIFQMYQC